MSDFWSLILIQAVICSLFCSFIAGQKNRDSTGWLALGFFFGIFALIAVAGLPLAPVRSDAEFGPDRNAERDPNRVSDMYWLGNLVGRLFGRRQ
jgi:uncharacterized membrane protein YbhN (UPF0104 family)